MAYTYIRSRRPPTNTSTLVLYLPRPKSYANIHLYSFAPLPFSLTLLSTTVLFYSIVHYYFPLLNRLTTVILIEIPTGSYFDKFRKLALTTATSISYSLACTNGLANSTFISCKPSSQAKSAKHLTFLLVRLLRQYRSFPFFPPKRSWSIHGYARAGE
jgi:hypothetical protein